MILTCPECATSYFVDDGKVGPQGRSVRCTGCGCRWHAKTEPVLELKTVPEIGAVAFEPAPEPVALAEAPAAELPKVFRARTEAKRNTRKAAVAGAAWAGIAASFVGLIASAAVFKVEMVKLWPKSASAYAMVGLPVNATGLEFEDISAKPALQDGRAALVVSGKIRNVEDRIIPAPPLRIILLDKSGKKVGQKISDPENAAVPPGETRHFVVSLIDPPAAAKDVEVAFMLDRKVRAATKPAVHGKAPAAAPQHAPGPTLHGPAESLSNHHFDEARVQDATPLPAGDPLALQPHG